MDANKIRDMVSGQKNAHIAVRKARDEFDSALKEWKKNEPLAERLDNEIVKMSEFDRFILDLEDEITRHYEKKYDQENNRLWIDYLTSSGFVLYVEDLIGDDGYDNAILKHMTWEEYLAEKDL